MPWITVKARILSDDGEKLKRMEVDVPEEDYFWTETAIRSEEIFSMYKKSNATTVVTFYEEVPKMYVREPYEELLKRIELLDYECIEEEENE